MRTTAVAAIAGTVGTSIPAVAAADEADELWRLPAESEAAGGPTVVGGNVYVTVDATSQTVYSIDGETGAENWEISGSFDGPELWGHPHVVDGTLYGASSEGMVKAIDIETQEEEWTFEPDGDYFGQPPKVAGDTVYVIGSETEGPTTLFAVDADDGAELWSHQGDGGNEESPIIAGDTVYYSTNSWVFAIDADDGEEIWSHELDDGSLRSVTVVGDTLYTVDTERTDGGASHAIVTALDADTGEDVWTFNTEEGGSTTPTVYDGMVLNYAGDSLVALDAGDGDELWRYSVDTGTTDSGATPTVADGVVYFGSYTLDPYGGTIHAVDANSGDGLWTAEIGDFRIQQPPIVSEGTLYAWAERDPDGLNDYSDLVALDLDGTGSSEDSRSLQAVHNHHEGWTGNASLLSDLGGTDDDGSTADDGHSGDDESTSEDGQSGDDDSAADDGTPGFGIATAVTALGGAGYALKRRFEEGHTPPE